MNRITVSFLMGVVALMTIAFASSALADCMVSCGGVLCSHRSPLVGIGEGPLVRDASGGQSVNLEQMHWSEEEGLSGKLVPIPGAYFPRDPTRVLAFLVRQDGKLFASDALPLEGTTAVCTNPDTKLSVKSVVEMATSKKCVEKAKSKGLSQECNDTSFFCSAAGTSQGVIALLVSALALALGLGGRKRRRGSV